MSLLTTAYHGHGKIDEEDVKLHLNQLLPENLGLVLVPDHELPRRQYPGLSNVVGWLEGEVGKAGTIPTPDLIDGLLARTEYEADGETQHDDVALVMVFDPANQDDVDLAQRAHDSGIRVLDLTNAAAEIIFEDEPAAEEEPPFPTDEPAGEPDADPAIDVARSPAEQVAQAAAAGMAAVQALKDMPAPVQEAPAAAGPSLNITITLPPETVQLIAVAIVEAMHIGAAAAIQEPPVVVPPLGQESPKAASTPKVENDPQPPGTIVHYYDANAGKYRLARGKKRDTEERVFLTPEEIAEAKSNNMF